jgi:hypothetical protein
MITDCDMELLPDKIIWTGREFGKYIVDKEMVKNIKPSIPKSYGTIKCDFFISAQALLDYPKSWKEVE